MADFDYKLNLTPPIRPEPDPLPTALPKASSTFEVGAGSEGPTLVDRQVDSSSEEPLREKFQEAADEARERLNEFADQAKRRLHDARVRLNERLPVWKRQARQGANDARILARHTATKAEENARRYPVQTIAAAAGAGFLIGATMRIWRSSRG